MKHFILVIGHDYRLTGLEFRRVCNNRMLQIETENKKNEDIMFHVIDFQKGKIFTREINYPSGVKTKKPFQVAASFKPITRANYKDYSFKDGQVGTLSILDVYKTVQEIGEKEPNSLFELSIISHGYEYGPILVNSYDDGRSGDLEIPSSLRDPDDKDPRPKDFNPSNMDTKSLSNFQNAFNASGFIWIWGCNFPRPIHEFLYKMEHNGSYKQNGLDDEVVFKFRNLKDFNVTSLEIVLFGELERFPDKRNVEIKFKYIKEYVCKLNSITFNQIIATKTKVKTFGPLLGTYTDFDAGRSGQMHVVGGAHLTFYKNYFGFTFDKFIRGTGTRGYGEYKPDFACIAATPPVGTVYPTRGGQSSPMPVPD